MEKIALQFSSPFYPERLRLRLGKKAPETLWCMGNLDLLKSAGIGFCGSRDASEKAILAARDCASQVAAEGMVAVSGYARGVDEAVHAQALESNGSTIVVMPEGINHFKIKRELAKIWDWSRVLVLSEFEPEDTWQAYRAMQRNQTIIGLSQAMIVVEARDKGGTIEAGRQALRMQTPLFALSFGEEASYRAGNRELQEKGAIPLKKSRSRDEANMARVFDTIAKVSMTPSSFGQQSQFAF